MPTDPLDAAKEAVEALKAKEGEAVTFPSDRIWRYLGSGVDIPSGSRPGIVKQLSSQGYIEPTGARTKAESEQRKGSPTSEYRLGSVLRSASTSSSAVSVPAGPESVAQSLQSFVNEAARCGFKLSEADLANFFLALSASPLVILAGISGTGKSWLPRIFAQLTGAAFYPIAVKPHWDDSADLFGYTPTLDPTRFVEKDLTKAVEQATNDPERLVIVLLDEMNLAHVEHYFSDFLSVIESRRRDEYGAYTTDALPLDLPDTAGSDANFSRLLELQLPPNLRVVGTANMDETTKPFSPKVLDRAFSIEFGKVDLTSFAIPESKPNEADLSLLAQTITDPENPVADYEVYEESKALFDGVASQLEEINEILDSSNLSIGYRTRSAILLYLWHWHRHNLNDVLPFKAALDLCILQKVLPRIRGTGEQLRETLVSLQAWLDNHETASPGETEFGAKWPYVSSASRVGRMIEQLEAEGATSFWNA